MPYKPQQRSPRYFGLLFLRGMAMGAADVVPGVSGGTIAFITGIYEELIESLRRCDYTAAQLLFCGNLSGAWQRVNGSFLLTLMLGILFSVFSLANVVTYCLQEWPIPIWSLFFGLVLAASVHLFRQVSGWNFSRVAVCLVGMALALLVSQLRPVELPSEWWVIMVAGAVAICAMILPGVSGGFLLLIMGLYSTVVEAVGEFQLDVLFVFALGCGLGLLCFSHALSWLLRRFHEATMASLTGFLFGSLVMLWPWKITTLSTVDRHGELRAVVQEVVLPKAFTAHTGEAAYIEWALVLFFIGLFSVLAIERLQALNGDS